MFEHHRKCKFAPENPDASVWLRRRQLLFELLLLVPAQQVYEARPGEGVGDVQGGQTVPGNSNMHYITLNRRPEYLLVCDLRVRSEVQQQSRHLQLVTLQVKILHRALRRVVFVNTDLRGCVERGVAAAGDRAVRVRPRHQQAVRRLRVPRPRPAHQQIRNLRGGISSYSHRLLVSFISDNLLERKHFVT